MPTMVSTRNRESTLLSLEDASKEERLSENAPGEDDAKSLVSAMSTPIELRDDSSSFHNEKLNLDTLGFYGRDAEKATLLKAFKNLGTSSPPNGECMAQGTERQIVLISGTSGTRKTKLTKILKDPVAQQNGLFVRGKFALNIMISQPYSSET